MEVKEAVKAALEYVADTFSDAEISNLGLEEVVYDDLHARWNVTVGFSRPWNYPKGVAVPLGGQPVRSYKVVEIRDTDGTATAIRMRKMGSDE